MHERRRQAGVCTFCAAAFCAAIFAVSPGHAQTGSEGSVGYLDNAIPLSTFRLRYDAGFDMNRPDRATYFYATWSELGYHPHGVQNGGVFFDPKARGPSDLPARVDYQEPSAYLELAAEDDFSGFISVPYRYVNLRNLQEDYPELETKPNPALAPNPGSKFYPEPNAGNEANRNHAAHSGISDINFGFKYAFIASERQYLTAQLRIYSPSGAAGLGLGTGHWSVEPSLLYMRWLSDRALLQGQLTDWIPIEGGAGAGQVLMYGLGLSYTVYQNESIRVAPVAEFAGWTVGYGFASFFGRVHATPDPGLNLPVTHGVENAQGTTIVNGKIGIRTFFEDGSSFYLGYGRALTGDRWYKDLVRAEYRFVW